MKCITAVTIGKLIEAHMEHDEEKFLSYANFIAEAYEESGEERSAKIIRSKISGENKKQSEVTLDTLDFLKEVYKTTIHRGVNDTVVYTHDKPRLEESLIVWEMEMGGGTLRVTSDGGKEWLDFSRNRGQA
ncbi:hypothetical protein B5F53_12020 [Blautia sp. An249]|uniref:hypothetical protein n=1 Tax=Blautia sp. An249 TaxID=1965603 RepID=UPI000B388F8D|nr:hypothetical protein [Blautia sp. An249]OUO77931.1 hypothetical protein B5F53_12020 [Blautia sp. An249]